MGPNEPSSQATEVARLVETVDQLAAIDQDRILRLVSLIARVPPSVQRDAQRMIGRLVAADPDSLAECTEAVDEIIEYLENAAVARSAPALSLATFAPVTESSSRWN